MATKFEISSNDIIYSPLSGGSGVSFGWASDSNSQLNYFLQSYTDSVYNAFIYENGLRSYGFVFDRDDTDSQILNVTYYNGATVSGPLDYTKQ